MLRCPTLLQRCCRSSPARRLDQGLEYVVPSLRRGLLVHVAGQAHLDSPGLVLGNTRVGRLGLRR